jgi:molybdate transport system substrate-binding protein
LTELTPQFEKNSGHKLNITWSSTSIIQKQIPEGGKLDLVKPKMKQTPPGVRAAAVIVKGDADLGFQRMSELIHEPGITILGLLPNEIQNWTTWSSGIPRVAEQGNAAHALQASRALNLWFSGPLAL